MHRSKKAKKGKLETRASEHGEALGIYRCGRNASTGLVRTGIKEAGKNRGKTDTIKRIVQHRRTLLHSAPSLPAPCVKVKADDWNPVALLTVDVGRGNFCSTTLRCTYGVFRP